MCIISTRAGGKQIPVSCLTAGSFVRELAQMQDYADYKVMTQEDRRKLFSLLQVLKRELDGPKPPAQVGPPFPRCCPVVQPWRACRGPQS